MVNFMPIAMVVEIKPINKNKKKEARYYHYVRDRKKPT